MVALVAFQLFTRLKIKDSYPQVASSGNEFGATGMERGPALFSEVDWHFIGVNHITCIHIKEGHLVACGYSQYYLFGGESSKFHITHSRVHLECF